MKKNNKANLFNYEHFYIVVFLVILLVFSFVFLAFNYINSNKKTNKGNTIAAVNKSEVKMNVSYEASEYISLDNAIPLSDDTGMKLNGAGNVMKFSVSSDIPSSNSALYEVYAIVDGTTTLNEKYIKIYLEKNDTKVFEPQIFKSVNSKDILEEDTVGMLLDNGKLIGNNKNNYTLKLWVDENYDNYKESKTFKVYLKVIGRQSS